MEKAEMELNDKKSFDSTRKSNKLNGKKEIEKSHQIITNYTYAKRVETIKTIKLATINDHIQYAE